MVCDGAGECAGGKIRFSLDNGEKFHYNIVVIGVWRSLVSRLVRVQEAAGSNPATPTKIRCYRCRYRFFFHRMYPSINKDLIHISREELQEQLFSSFLGGISIGFVEVVL